MVRIIALSIFFFFSSRRRHTRCSRDWSSDVCSSDLGAGDLVLEHAQALGFTGLTGCSLGESDAGLIGFGARLVERAAHLLEPALEQQGPIRAGWRASTRGRYAFSQGKRPMRHYSEMREFAKPGCFGYGYPNRMTVWPIEGARGQWPCRSVGAI